MNNDDTPHGLLPGHIEALARKYSAMEKNSQDKRNAAVNKRLDSFSPGIASTDPDTLRSQAMEEEYRRIGAAPSPLRHQANGGALSGMPGQGSGTMVSSPMPYQPEFSSPDRQSYPVHRVLANRYFRLFHKLDPVIGNVIDLLSEMPFSDFQLTGEGVDGEVKDHYEAACEETQLLSLLPFFVREFLVVGEAVVHAMWSAEDGMWNYLSMHNPDSIEIIDAPFIKMDPIIEMIPDDRLRSILQSGDPTVQKIRAQLPPELIARLMNRQNIPLDNLNCTFIPRKLHPYDTRGTSIISRLWRVLMLEDAVFAANLATARRHAGPLKIAKLGNPQTGWMPGEDSQRKLLELLAQAEIDPHAWLVYHFGVTFETVGTTDRVISVGKEWETLERIKLVGLGVSKAFTTGEVTYASSAAGLQVFLQRLKALREFFESKWIYPKFFRPMAEINKFVKPSQAELNHRVRVRRTAQEVRSDRRFIIPTVNWNKTLDPNIDRDMIAAIEALSRIGCKFSKKTMMATVGLKFEDEMKSSIQEQVEEVQQRQQVAPILGPAALGPSGTDPSNQDVQNFTPLAPAPAPGQPGGPPAHAMSPPPRPGMPQAQPPARVPPPPVQQQAASPDGIVRTPMMGPQPVVEQRLKGKMWERGSQYKNWSLDEAVEAVGLMREGASEEPFWQSAVSDRFRGAQERGDLEEAWDDLTLYLGEQGYSDDDISDLRDILVSEWVLKPEAEDFAKKLFESLPDDLGGENPGDPFLRAFQGTSGFSSSERLTSKLFTGE